MSAEAEMRRVLGHAADQLRDRMGAIRFAPIRPAAIEVIADHIREERLRDAVAFAFAEGVLRLLASYLAVEDAPRAQPTSGVRDERGRFTKADAS